MHLAADDPEGQSRVAAFLQGLQEAGWAVGRNVNIDVRWAAGEADRYRRYAMEIVALTPDVILTSAPPSIRAMQQATRTVPIVFVLIPDAVGTGIVDSLSRPGGNTTGFTSTELGMPVKWLELLKDIAPKMTRAAVLRDAADATAIGQFGAVKGAAPSFGVEISPIGVANAEEIERGITAFAREPNGGLIVLPVPTTVIHRTLIIKLAASIGFQRSIIHAIGLPKAASCHMDQMFSTSTAARPAMLIASSGGRSRPTCRYRRRPNTSW